MKKKLKDLLDYEQPTKYIVETENYSDEYKLPVLTAGKSFVLGYTDETEGVFKGKNEPVIIFDDFTRDTKYVDFDFKVKSSAMKILHKHNKDDSLKYLHYALNNIKYVPFSHKRLWISDFSNMEIDYPSPDIQNTIATELDTIQSAIDNKKQQLSLLDEAVKSEFVEMFSDLECNIKTIEQTCTMKSGTTFSKDEENDYGEIFYIKVSGMNLPENDKYIKTSLSFVSRKVAGKTIIPANSIIFPKRGGAIGTNKKRITEQEICIDLNTMAVTPSNELNIQYLYQYFQNLDMGKLYNGSTVPQINNKDIGPLKIKVPPLELQNQFAAFVQQIDKSKFVVKQQIADLQELLDSKMQEYFS